MRRVAIISGAGSGIGRATALLLSKSTDLFKVVATDVNVEALESLHEEAPDIRPEVMDVTKYEDVETIIPGIANSEGGVHVLVNAAGIMPIGPIELMSEDWHHRAFEVNYFGTVRCSKTALPYMREGAGAIAPLRPRLVNISSTAGLIGLPFADAYCATKFAVEGLSEAMALTLPQLGVDVSLVEPGAVATRLTTSMSLSVKELVAEVIKKVLTAEGPPHLRNITSKQAKRLAAHKYNDLNGDKTLAAVQDFMEKVWHVRRDFKAADDKPPSGGVV